MKAIGFGGTSGSGKTTLIERLIPALRARRQRVSIVKHAHHAFEIDHEGKDSWRHRRAGAFEVVVASDRRLAKIREYEAPREPSVHDLLGELSPCDWALVEGFKHADLPKIEVWRSDRNDRPMYPDDPFVVAIVADAIDRMPASTALPRFQRDDIDAIVDFLMSTAARYDYRRSAAPADAHPR